MPEDEQLDSADKSENTLDSLLGAETEEAASPALEEDKSEKKERDFERAFFKQKEETKRLKEELAARDTQVAPEQQLNQEGDAYLRNLIRETVEPYFGTVVEKQERDLITDFQRDNEYADALAEPMLNYLASKKIERPTREDLEIAYSVSLKNNLPKIIEVTRGVGQEEGFKNRAFKQAQGSMRESSKISKAENDIMERYDKGELSSKELEEHADDIEAWETENLGVSKVYL